MNCPCYTWNISMISSDSLQEPNGFVEGGENFSMYISFGWNFDSALESKKILRFRNMECPWS
jgi:hypothetical protein